MPVNGMLLLSSNNNMSSSERLTLEKVEVDGV